MRLYFSLLALAAVASGIIMHAPVRTAVFSCCLRLSYGIDSYQEVTFVGTIGHALPAVAVVVAVVVVLHPSQHSMRERTESIPRV